MSPTSTSCAIIVKENIILRETEPSYQQSENTLYVGNMFRFIMESYLTDGYSFEDRLEMAINHVKRKGHQHIETLAREATMTIARKHIEFFTRRYYNTPVCEATVKVHR
jgi:hypothetical protein